jgi:lipid II:glycine glycyltransferase (peptidoglycan interpeptide bridge formation enzyme)
MGTLEQLHRENITGKGGLCKSETFFDLIPKHFRPNEDYKIFTATLEGEIIAALLLFYFKNSVEYFTPAINEEVRQLQPLALIIYEAMVDAAKRGYTTWNWGGTWESQEGVFRFKKKWGSLSKNYRYFTQLNLTTLREKKASDLLADCPNFYVLPFSNLLEVTQV